MGSVKKIPPIIGSLVLLLYCTSGDDYVLFADDLETGKVKLCMRLFSQEWLASHPKPHSNEAFYQTYHAHH
jgi:hypothetical protein